MRTEEPCTAPQLPEEKAEAAAEAAGLCHAGDDRPGIVRIRINGGFRYVAPDGKPVRDEKTLARIKSLAIPPAWSDVWICPLENAHLQATGRDARGRKQYRYHPRWRSVRDETKYGRMLAFGKALPGMREKVGKALALRGLPREKMLATVVCLLQITLMRIGNEEYARHNRSFGLTTLRDRHARIDGSEVELQFRGKSGVRHSVKVNDPRLARIIRKSRDLPGQELFQYIDDDGRQRVVGSADVNDYLREISGEDYTAKDFRTWAGTVLAALALAAAGPFDTQARAKKNIAGAIEAVAERLGNTPAVCRKCYVHPAVIEAYLDGALPDALRERRHDSPADDMRALSPEEAAVIALLEERQSSPDDMPAKASRSRKAPNARRPRLSARA